MNRSLTIRGLVIAGVAALLAFSAWPPKEKINLGLDLRGGMHLVLQVETSDALRAEADLDADRLVSELGDEDVKGVKAERTGDTTFELSGVPADRDGVVRDVVDRYLPGWISSRNGDKLQFEMTGDHVASIRDLAVRQAVETIRKRIDAFGVTEPTISRSGDRVVVQLPGVDDPERIKRLLKNTAFLEFRLVVQGTGPTTSREALIGALGGRVPDDVEILEETVRDENGKVVGDRYWAIEKRRVITGRDLKTARPSSGEFNEPVVSFILTADGGRKFGEETGAHQGRNLAIILDGRVVSAPTIESRITDSGIIRGSFTQQEVQDLATVLRSGALPAGLTYLEERTVGPSLGQDSIDKGKQAGLLGFVLVVLCMLVVYNRSGINATSALVLNIVLIFGALAFFDGTLTLPGIAGIVLTIGMAVDANVLIFERIREEIRSGKTVKSAIATGFERALSAIVDGNLTTLLAALFLFMFGTGPIRGFAVTLSIGIVASLFTAVFVSRWMFDLFVVRLQRVDKLSI
ncbi:MAG: protein translocase subunit SecD [Thermoanaerobaculia bacterium]|nr:protein translocase subunit SecD [Thermoanaerobaculia bacterium]